MLTRDAHVQYAWSDAELQRRFEYERLAVDSGGDGALGHPLVYLNMEKRGAVDCPYCGRKFVLKAGAKAAAH